MPVYWYCAFSDAAELAAWIRALTRKNGLPMTAPSMPIGVAIHA
jgi:hypothetical protein